MSKSKPKRPKLKLFQKAPPAPYRKPPTIDHFGGRLPQSLPPSTYIRRWDNAFILGASAAAMAFVGTGLLAWHEWPFLNTPPGGMLFNLEASAKTLAWLATGGQSFGEFVHDYWVGRATDIGLLSRFSLIFGSTLYASQWAFRRSLIPRNGIRHVSGSQLLRGEEAVKGFQHEAKEMGVSQDNALLQLHPSAMWPAHQWKYHLLLDGGTGAGKTQAILYWLKQIFEQNHRLFLYDIKGDFTRYFYGREKKGHRRGILLSVFDSRSHVWDIAKDINTRTRAAAFAQSMIPVEEGNGKYWSQAAQMLFEATLISLQHDMPEKWGFFDLRRRLDLGRIALAELVEKYSPKASNTIVDDSQASTSVLGTLSSYTQKVDTLSEAWARPIKGKTFSFTDWTKDGYKGPKQVIVQGGEDDELASLLISSMVNVCVKEIVSAKLADDMNGRHIFFFLDEFTSLKPLRVGDLLDKARSKGVGVVLAYQAVSQVIERYGQNLGAAMTSMVGSKIHFKQGEGDTRDQIIKLAGRRRVAVTNTTISGGFTDGVAGSSSVAEEERDILTPQDLSNLGAVRDAKGKFLGVKAIVHTGGDYHELLFPPMQLSQKDQDGNVVPGLVPAAWTLPGYKSILPRTRTSQAIEEEQFGGGGVEFEKPREILPEVQEAPTPDQDRPDKPQRLEVVHVRPDKDRAVPVEAEDMGGHLVVDAMMEHFGGKAMTELMNALVNGDEAGHSNNRVTPIHQDIQLKKGRE